MPTVHPQVADFSLPTTADEVASVLGISATLFQELIATDRKANYYTCHRIPKRRPKTSFREVWECNSDEVATVHKTVARRLALFLETRMKFPHAIAHGYVSNRSTATNALVHAGAYLMLRADISNFFGTITRDRISQHLRDLQIPTGAANALSDLCTLNGILPLGLHASPLLANLACVALDWKLVELAKLHNAKVTRYADDITFSGNAVPSIDEVGTILEGEGFSLARAKCRKTKCGQAHYVTGLSISDKKPHVPKLMKRRIRQELHFSKKYGLVEHLARRGGADVQSAVNRITGTIFYINAVEPALATHLLREWQSILKPLGISTAYAPRAKLRPPITIFVDETDIQSADGAMLAIAMALVADVQGVQDKLEHDLRGHLIDPCATGDKATLQKTGLHYVDVSEDLRTTVFKSLESLPIRGYIAYSPIQSQADYANVYSALVRGLLRHRLMFCDGAEVTLVFEQNDKLKLPILTDVVQAEFELLERKNDRRPKALPSVRFGSKLGDPCLAIADFLLAAFRNYAVLDAPRAQPKGKKQAPGELATKRFERLRDRTRLVLALPSRKSFGRRNPFRPWPDSSPSKA